MATIDIKQLTKAVVTLVKTLNPRNRDIISRRFGLKSGTKETLESIGRGYGITRERVRQIEEFSLAQLVKAVTQNRELEKFVGDARELIDHEGGVIAESALFRMVSGNDRETVANAALSFALTLDRTLVRVSDNDRLQACWAQDKTTLDAFRGQVSALVGAFESQGDALPMADVPVLAQKHSVAGLDGSVFSDRHLATLTAISKDIGRNIFGEMGLSHWPQVRPKGVRDKAYLVIKKSGKPQHFSEIAKLINVAKFDAKKTNVQTVHNELIKDSRFVLVGRGLYALAEWGYKSGTVRDVLTDILKANGKPLQRAELIAKVKDVRLVKDNTILLNLQDSGTFVRDGKGHYSLRRNK